MRLLDTTTIELSEFFDADIPPYAILSHTWGKNEVTFQDLDCVRSKGPQAYSKIAACCAKAASHGVKWVWIDTCCIDKSSSAELSEAINSMYRWYEKSEECYAYLEDVSIDNMDQFGSSRWFTRGWTLQELLAPPSLAFYDKDWEYLGSKQDLSKVIALTTKIPESTISLGNFSYKIGSAAAIMSWASKRQTSRIEDTAYCLMGLFDINMPLLYGEGGKAFTRLQHEIVKNQDDESILAWTDKTSKRSGMFARSPAVFANSGDVVRRNFDVFRRPEPSTVTSRGLSMQLVGKVECNDDPKTEEAGKEMNVSQGHMTAPGHRRSSQFQRNNDPNNSAHESSMTSVARYQHVHTDDGNRSCVQTTRNVPDSLHENLFAVFAPSSLYLVLVVIVESQRQSFGLYVLSYPTSLWARHSEFRSGS